MTRYPRAALDHLLPPRDVLAEKLSDVSALPSMDRVRALASWDAELLDRFDRTPDALLHQGVDRSSAMAEFSYLAAEHGWADDQILAALFDLDSRWGKFKDRYNRLSLLVDLVNRARAKVGYGVSPFDAKAMVERLEQGTTGSDPSKKVMRWGDFLASDFHIDWMLDGLLARTGIGLITGFPGVGKTQLCLGMAAHMATGADRFLLWPNAAGPQRVLFLSLEMSGPPLHHFQQEIDRGYGRKDLLQQNFFIYAPGTPLPLDTKEGQDYLDALLAEYAPDVLVIDSLQKIASRELTDETSVKNLIHYLHMAKDKHKCAMLIVHHHRKKSNDSQKKDGVELSDVYGSTYITTDVDFVLSLRKKTDDVLTVDTLKNRLSKENHPFDVTRDANLGFDVDGMAAARQFGQASGLDVK